MSKKAIISVLFILLLLPTSFVLAQGSDAREVKAETVHGDVTLLNENLNLADSGRINGSVTILNGDATIAGVINQDLVVFNGDIFLEETAVIRGECVAINGTVSGSTKREQFCRSISELPLAALVLKGSEAGPGPGAIEIESPFSAIITQGIGAVALSLVMALIAAGVYAYAPTPSQRIEQAMKERPLATTAVGLLSFGAVPFINLVILVISSVLLIVCVGILGFPLMLAITLAFVGAGFWTWALWGKLLGNWVATRLNWQPNPTLIVALGTAVVTLALSLISFSSPVGAGIVFILLLIPMAWGMGATALTRFGTRPYPVLAPATPVNDKITAVLETLPVDPSKE